MGITFGTLRDITAEYDEVWCIVRSLKNMPSAMREGQIVRHVPDLSPSSDLFHKYLKWKKTGCFNHEKFVNEYVPVFLEEMHSIKAVKALNFLYAIGKEKNVLCVCYCPTEELCHRSIICGLLQGVGGVEVHNSNDYKLYYELWKQIQSKPEEPSVANTGKTVCFTGSRPSKLHGYVKEPYQIIVDKVADTCRELYDQGFRNFITGGAQGFDQLAFWAVNSLKKEHPDIKNIVYVPYHQQDERWMDRGLFSKSEHRLMLKIADEVKTLYEVGSERRSIVNALLKRNHAMVQSSDLVIGLYPDCTWKNEDTAGGTAECLRYAKIHHKNMIQIMYDPKKQYKDIHDIPSVYSANSAKEE
jgi:uncharacterized phage-like protein YoqJ/uncharacterized protein YeaO (DUF488 family)